MIRSTSFLLWCFLALSSTLSFAQTWTTISANDPRIHYVGRTWPASTPTSKMMGWSGTSASLSFEGTAVKALLARPSGSYGVDSSWYKVLIDGQPTQDIAYKNFNQVTEIMLAENLPQGTHTVTLYKRTEIQTQAQVFSGFSVLGTSTTTLAIPSRRIEFIGNSITCGYGILDSCTVNPNTWQIEGTCPGYTTTGQDHYYTYASLTARAVGAENQTLCWSGIGLYRNNSGNNPTMPLLWEFGAPLNGFADTSRVARWDFNKYIPHLVVINLGTNDFSYSTNPPQQAFVNTYVAFIRRIQQEYGDSIPIILLHGPMLGDSYPAGLQVATTLSNYIDLTIAATGPNVHKLILSPNQSLTLGIGAHWHPNKAQNRLNATELETKIRSVLGWQGTGDPTVITFNQSYNAVQIQFHSPNQLQLIAPNSTSVQLQIIDLNGQIHRDQQHQLKTGHNNISLQSNLPKGVYIIKASTAQNSWTKQIVVQ